MFSYGCLLPPGQKKPLGQRAVGAERPAVMQYEPSVQLRQSEMSDLPVLGLKVPEGHKIG